MRGLIKLTHAASTLEAWRDWRKLAQEAEAAGLSNLVDDLRPKSNAGHRTIDRQADKLRLAMKSLETGE